MKIRSMAASSAWPRTRVSASRAKTATGVADAIRAYERVMSPRSAEIAHHCAEGLDDLLAPTTDQAHSHLLVNR